MSQRFQLAELFKAGSGKKKLTWKVEVEDGKYRTVSGQVGGKLVTSEWTVCTAKNVGKTNEIFPDEQAWKEAEAEWTKKKKKGYSETGEFDGKLRPMLAHPLDDHPKVLQYPKPWHLQPKLDGIRGLLSLGELTSRNALPIASCPHIIQAAAGVFAAFQDLVALDGELYNHELRDDFDAISSLVTTKKPTREHTDKTAEQVKFYLFDAIFEDDDLTWEWRRVKLEKIATWLQLHTKPFVLVPTYQVTSEEEADRCYDHFLDNGYEGMMYRDPQGTYTQGRKVTALLKRKDFVDEECLVTGTKEGTGKMAGAFSFECVTPAGVPFDCPINAKLPRLKEMFPVREKFVGNHVTVRRAAKLTPRGKPRFPKATKMRELDPEGNPYF